MPKEVIRCERETREVSTGGTNEETVVKSLARDVVVNWYKHPQDEVTSGGVFVGVTNQDGEKLHAEMTRSEINRLIRTLRRARDGAFGADA